MAIDESEAGATGARVDRGRLIAAQEAAARFYKAQLRTDAGAGPSGFLARAGVSVEGAWVVGFAPDRPSGLVHDLRGWGFSDIEIVAAGLAHHGPQGQLMDRFRNRVMVGLRDGPGRDAPLVGFAGYAPPRTGADVRRWLYSSATVIHRPQSTLFGIAELAGRVGHRPILAANPLDAIVVSERTAAAASPPLVVAPASQHLTRRHVELLEEIADLSGGVAVTLRTDDEGRRVAERAFRMFAPVVGANRVFVASWSTGWENTRSLAEALGHPVPEVETRAPASPELEDLIELPTGTDQQLSLDLDRVSLPAITLEPAASEPTSDPGPPTAAELRAEAAEEVEVDAAVTSGHELPDDAEPVEGVDGYRYAVREDQTTIYGPDDAVVATATRIAYELTVGDVDGVRISGYSYTSTDATFALLAARQHHMARLPPEHRDRVWVEIVPDTSAKSGRVIAVFGTDKHNRDDREAVKTQAKLVWSGRRQAWVSSRPWTAPTVDEKLARLLAEFARQGRNVVVQNHTPEREAAVDPQTLADDDKPAAVLRERQDTTGEVEPVPAAATGPSSQPELAARSYSRTALLVVETRLSDQREVFRAAYAELEAQALTSKELREAGQATTRRDFADVASRWIEDTVRAKSQADELWERFAPTYFGADVRTRVLIDDYLTTRVWEHCAPVSPTAGIDQRDDQLEPYQGILGEYEGMLGQRRCAAVARLATKIAREHEGAPRSQGDEVSRAFAELEHYAVQETLSLERDIQAAAGAGQTEDLRALIHAEWELLRQGRHLDQWLVSNREVVATFVAAEHARAGQRAVETAGPAVRTAGDPGEFDRALTSIREPVRDQFRRALAELEAAALTEANLTKAARIKPEALWEVAHRWVDHSVRGWMSDGSHTDFVKSYLGAYAEDNTRAEVNEYITRRVSEHCMREALLASVDGVARPEQAVDPLGSYRERLGTWRVAAIENRSEEVALHRGGRDDPDRLRERASRAFDELSEFDARETWSLERTMQVALEAARLSMELARELEEHNDHVAAETHRALAAKSSEQVTEVIDAEWELFKEGAHLDIWLARHGETVAAFVASERARAAEYEAPVRDAAQPLREPDLGVGMA